MSEPEKVVTVSYGGNSDQKKKAAATPPPEKPERKVEALDGVVVSQRKKPLGRKIAETFTAEDMGSVGSHIVQEVVVPAIKVLIFDIGMEALNRTLFGGRGARPSAARGGGGTVVQNHTAYNRMSSPSRTDERDISRSSRRAHDFDEIIFENRGQAERVMDSLVTLIDEYGTCTVADLYALVNITETYSDTQFGWRSLHDARVKPTRNGYFIELPPAQALK